MRWVVMIGLAYFFVSVLRADSYDYPLLVKIPVLFMFGTGIYAMATDHIRNPEAKNRRKSVSAGSDTESMPRDYHVTPDSRLSELAYKRLSRGRLPQYVVSDLLRKGIAASQAEAIVTEAEQRLAADRGQK